MHIAWCNFAAPVTAQPIPSRHTPLEFVQLELFVRDLAVTVTELFILCQDVFRASRLHRAGPATKKDPTADAAVAAPAAAEQPEAKTPVDPP